jgi:hypothetical protein
MTCERPASTFSSSSLHNFLASRASFLLENFLGKKEPGLAIACQPGLSLPRNFLVLVDVMHPTEWRLGHGILHQLGHFKDCVLADNELV